MPGTAKRVTAGHVFTSRHSGARYFLVTSGRSIAATSIRKAGLEGDNAPANSAGLRGPHQVQQQLVTRHDGFAASGR